MLEHPSPGASPAEARPTEPVTATDAASDAVTASPMWSEEVQTLMLRAAQLCADHDVEPDAFMQAAWAACLESRPGLREQLADATLMEQVDNLRKRGMVGAS